MQHQPEKYWSLISHKTPHEPSNTTKKETLYEPQILTQDVLTPPSWHWYPLILNNMPQKAHFCT